jgi:hypothetical protein
MIFPTIDHRRLIPIFLILTLPFFGDLLKNLKLNIQKYKVIGYLMILTIIVLLEFNLYNRFTSYNLYSFTEEDYCYFASECSVKAVNYFISNPPNENGFNYYDWGGYLIGKNVPVKLFIDGRMHVWTGDNGYNVFAEYDEILTGNQYFEKFKQYDFNWLLIPRSTALAQEILASDKLGSWKQMYSDGNTVYFVKEK